MAEIVLYVDGNFGGLHTHLFRTEEHFTRLARGGVGRWYQRDLE